MRMGIILVVGGLLLSAAASAAWAAEGPHGGVFIPRNGGFEGRLGQAHVYIEQRQGGVLSAVRGQWPRLEPLARVDLAFAVKLHGKVHGVTETVEVRQSFDASPEVLFLEEGGQRLGVRVKFKLYDAQHTYHGHGMTETWLYPDGQMFVTAAATMENPGVQAGVASAAVEMTMPEGFAPTAAGAWDQKFEPGKPLPLSGTPGGGHVFFSNAGDAGLGLYWRGLRMEKNTFIFRPRDAGAPYYWRWPDYLRQAYLGAPAAELVAEGNIVRLAWPVQTGGDAPRPVTDFATLFRLLPAGDAAAVRAAVEAEREPVTITVAGGEVHGNLGGYNDQEGAYELRKTGQDTDMVVTLPADALGRTISIKAIQLGWEKAGAIVVTLDGRPLVPQLSSDGGIADDPLAPIREQPEGCADMAVVNVRLTDKPQTLVVSEVPGVQLTYQTRDPWRSFGVFSDQTGVRYAGLRFSPVDGRARNMRAYGKPEWALTENLLTWFSFCGYTPGQMVDQLRDLVILKNGPDEVIFRYTSVNADEGAQSEYTVRIPADAPAQTIDVTARFTVLERWPYPSAQFFDVFPFRGVNPRDWWYDETLWVANDGRWKTRHALAGTFEGDEKLEELVGGGFFALYSSDRGNMAMLVQDFSPPDLSTHYVICGNYIDYHMDLQFRGPDGKPAPPAKGFETTVRYELAVWGDQSVTREQMIDLGKRSIAAKKLALPK